MIFTLLLPLFVSTALLGIRVNATPLARECRVHEDQTTVADEEPFLPACAGNTLFALVPGTPIRRPTSEPTTYARPVGIERRLLRTIRPEEERAIRPTDDKTKTPTPTTHSKTRTRTETMHTIVPVEERDLLPVEDVPSWTPKPKPTIKTRLPVQEREFEPETGPSFTPHPTGTISIKTSKSVTRIKPTLATI